ncbi:DedA family protein [Chitinophaga sancti]|uniref:Membrane-associated protein n=1 Tax=Chitinophaga sancti TaxID=1004 RepID=A0A1K1QB30_9BACT|nr:VTT domain-containing protein [Chitinophaga sancti]WQD61309.1 VTT domain-containing protein [Chitinophaga sancti]WQG86563.1 VTT domain-containing protein [Chitinophaga sancti]SFW56933.1 membrane-associated protein [Chitinophaga sancti]
MDQFIELFKHLINPEWIINHGGLYLLLIIIFAETGLFVGFFLPGDSLLFVAGIYGGLLSNAFYDVPFFLIMFMIAVAGVLGNFVGFWFGRKSGPLLFSRKDTLLFKKKHLYQAKEFYDKHGGGAIFLARFLPIIRTFAPIVAGIVGMDKKKFMFFNIISSFTWVFSMMLAGHYLDKAFPSLKEHLELIVIILILITTLPVIIKLFFSKPKHASPPHVD